MLSSFIIIAFISHPIRKCLNKATIKFYFLGFSKTQKTQDGIPDYLSYGMSSSVHPLADFCFGYTVNTFHQFTLGCVKKMSRQGKQKILI
jgi:hypothetical protein